MTRPADEEPLTPDQAALAASCVHLAWKLARDARGLDRYLKSREERRAAAEDLLLAAARKFRPEYLHPETDRPVKFSSYAAAFLRRNLWRLTLRLADAHLRDGVVLPALGRDRPPDREVDDGRARAALDAADAAGALVAALPVERRRVLVGRYGLFGEAPRTVGETAERMGLTPAQVVAVELETIAALRAAVGADDG